MACLILIGGRLAFGAQAPSRTPSPTPTPRHRLTGGFGRPAATPVVAQEGGQSLSDVVKAASESKVRKEQRPNVAITNETLVTDPKRGKLTIAEQKSPPQPTPSQTAQPALTPSPNASLEGETEWRQRGRSARQRVEDAKARVYQLEGETASLEKDFYRWDDGQYRDGVIKPAWDKKKEELEAARKELEQAERTSPICRRKLVRLGHCPDGFENDRAAPTSAKSLAAKELRAR